jgi:peptidoglycan/LPS O-acetylase OafA/YrhL
VIPVYFFSVILVWSLHSTGQPREWLELLQHLAFVQTFNTQNIFQTIGPAWIFSVEIWFYIFLACFTPLIYFFSTLSRSPANRAMILYLLTIVFITAGVGYKIWLYSTSYLPTDSLVLYYSLPSRFDNFAFGMVLAVILAVYEKHKRKPLFASFAFIVALLLAIGALYYSSSYLSSSPLLIFYFCQIMWEMIAFLQLVAMAAAMDTSRPPVKERRRQRVWVYLGSISYAMLLWYEPVFSWLNGYFIASTVLFFVLSLLSFIVITLCVASLNYWIIAYPASFLSHLFTSAGELNSRYLERF